MTKSLNNYKPGNIKPVHKIFFYIILIIGACYSLFPLFWIFLTSIKAPSEIYSANSFFPKDLSFASLTQNYREIMNYKDGSFYKWLFNSLFISLATTVVGLFLASTAAYALSRFKFPGSKAVLFSFLLTQMFPGIMLIVPLYNIMKNLGLLNTYSGLVIAYSTTALPFCVFMLKSFFDNIPKSLEDAAKIDGLSSFAIFWRIIIPLSVPGLAVTGFFSLITAWNEYMYALTFMSSEENYTLPVGMKLFINAFKIDWHLISAIAVIVTLPITLIFLKMQTYLISGKLSGAVKG